MAYHVRKPRIFRIIITLLQSSTKKIACIKLKANTLFSREAKVSTKSNNFPYKNGLFVIISVIID